MKTLDLFITDMNLFLELSKFFFDLSLAFFDFFQLKSVTVSTFVSLSQFFMPLAICFSVTPFLQNTSLGVILREESMTLCDIIRTALIDSVT
jgi:hypothetical protein